MFPHRCEGQALAALWSWLTPQQIESALSYYATYPDEIDRRSALESTAANVAR